MIEEPLPHREAAPLSFLERANGAQSRRRLPLSAREAQGVGSVPPMDDVLGEELHDRLVQVLTSGQRIGINGGDIVEQIDHARWFAEHWPGEAPPGTLVDLGSGGGLPGLVLAGLWPTTHVVLSETRGKRADFLARSSRALGWASRVRVVGGDVQAYARSEAREMVEMVSARAFGPPATVAECAAPLLRIGGHLVVSEPPMSLDRWPSESLAQLGLRMVAKHQNPNFVVFIKAESTPDEFPRRRKSMDDRPIFSA